ncbi:MAG: YraN family protein [Xanthomonadaceae bacterium]|nr:YraN family protein [Xanthomonadaceae bacterium]
MTVADDRRGRGAQVEALARAYLERQGLRAVAANANFRFGELDLVMLDGDTLVFVEVRYRREGASARGFGGGAASIDASKRRKLVAAAETFLQSHRAYARAACRFDAVVASGDPDVPTFDWLRDAFRADDV